MQKGGLSMLRDAGRRDSTYEWFSCRQQQLDHSIEGKKSACHSSNLDTFFPTIADQYVSEDGTMVERNWGRGGRVSRTRERVGKQKCWKAVSHQGKCAIHGKNC